MLKDRSSTQYIIDAQLDGLVTATTGSSSTITLPTEDSTIVEAIGELRNNSEYQKRASTHHLFSCEFESLEHMVFNTSLTLTMSDAISAVHPGVVRLGTSTTQWASSAFRIGHHTITGQSHRPFYISNVKRAKLICKFPQTITNTEFLFGLYTSASNQNYNTDGVFCYLTGSNLSFKTRSGGSQTVTSVATLTTDTWYEFEIVQESATAFRFYMNGTSYAYHTSHIPTGICGIGGNIQTATTAAKDIDLDYLEAEIVVTGNRY